MGGIDGGQLMVAAEGLLVFTDEKLFGGFVWRFHLQTLEVLTGSDYYVSKLPAGCKNGWGYAEG